MRIGYMGNMDSPNTRVWIEEMRERGVDPVAISVEKPGWDIEWDPLRIERPPVRGLGLGWRMMATQVRHVCERRGLDLLHTHEADGLAYAASLSRFSPRLITCWGSDVLRMQERPVGLRMGVRSALGSADAITVGSHHLLDAAVHAGAHRQACVLVGWGVDTSYFRRDLESRVRIRSEWNLEDRDVLLSTRLHKPLYRIDAILKAFALALRENESLALVVAGWGSETERLKSLAEELDVADDVRFIGRVARGEWPSMPDVYSGADVFCSIPETDGGPLSVLEAMACELPVVASNVPVMREWIIPGNNGFIWDDESIEGLAHLLPIAMDAGLSVGREARGYVRAHHERAHEMDKVHLLYRRLLRASGESRLDP